MTKSKPSHSNKAASTKSKTRSGTSSAALKTKPGVAGSKGSKLNKGTKLRDRAELDKLDGEGLRQVRIGADRSVKNVVQKKQTAAKLPTTKKSTNDLADALKKAL